MGRFAGMSLDFRWMLRMSVVPPERLPRRAARGLGARSPHQTGSVCSLLLELAARLPRARALDSRR